MNHISLGENCLPQYLLSKYKINGPSSIFSSSRCNIRIINKIIADNFDNFLNPDHIKYERINNKFDGCRNVYYKTDLNIFCPTVSNGFEFTHHNLNNDTQRESILRKIERFKLDLLEDNLVFWYHYRYSKTNDITKLLECFNEFDKKVNSAKYVIFQQIPIGDPVKFEHEKMDNFNIIKCYDPMIWAGPNRVFAKNFQKCFDSLFNDYDILNNI